jgi:anti-sigma factor RsiW
MTDLTCDQLDTLLAEFLDGSLAPDVELAAAEHLATCNECRVQVSELEGVGELYRRHGRSTLPPEARERIRNLLGVEAE